MAAPRRPHCGSSTCSLLLKKGEDVNKGPSSALVGGGGMEVLSRLVVLFFFPPRSVTAGDTSLITFSHLNHLAYRIIDFLFLSLAFMKGVCVAVR